MAKLMFAVALPLVLLAAVDPDRREQDQAAIKQTALDYAEGWYEGNAERMERALHPDLAKRVLVPDSRSGKGKIDHMSAMSLVQLTRSGAGKTPPGARKANVTILEVYGNAACVKVEMNDWVDFLHMSRIGGRWLIVNVLWEFSPEAKKKYGMPEEL